jgi:hypothetical protein
MMCLVDDHHVSQFSDTLEPRWKIPFAPQVGVTEYGKIAEVRSAANSTNVRRRGV